MEVSRSPVTEYSQEKMPLRSCLKGAPGSNSALVNQGARQPKDILGSWATWDGCYEETDAEVWISVSIC